MPEYPDRILPKAHYSELPLVDLMSKNEVALIRKYKSADSPFDPSTEMLRSDIFSTDSDNWFFDLSCSLYPCFLSEHFSYLPLNEFRESYLFGESVPTPVLGENYELDESEFTTYLIDIRFIEAAGSPVLYQKENKEQEAYPKTYHKPTKGNYWHYQIHWLDENGQEIKYRKKKAWATSLADKIKSAVREWAFQVSEEKEFNCPIQF